MTDEQFRDQVEWAIRDYREGRLKPESGVMYALVKRLVIAEDVCIVSGWTPMADSKRGKALHELWARWYHLVGEEWGGPSKHPHLDDEHIAALAAKRDETRRRTLEALIDEETP